MRVSLTTKPSTLEQLAPDRLEQVVVEVADGPAASADEVVVHRRRGDLVVGDRAVQSGLLDELQPDEQLECAVDRGDVDLGQRLLHLGGDLLGGAMAPVAAHRLPDRRTLRREAVAGLADRFASVVHGATLSQPRTSCNNHTVAASVSTPVRGATPPAQRLSTLSSTRAGRAARYAPARLGAVSSRVCLPYG